MLRPGGVVVDEATMLRKRLLRSHAGEQVVVRVPADDAGDQPGLSRAGLASFDAHHPTLLNGWDCT